MKHNLNINDFELSEIESIELIGDTETIDITVDDTHMFYANDVYSHNSGADHAIIEGTSAAGSYDKIMISDFCMSLSRKKEDKVNGTGRTHIMKNRYGSDGDTYNVSVNTNISKITFLEKFDEEETNIVEQRLYKKQFNEKEKEYLSNKFFEISNNEIQ